MRRALLVATFAVALWVGLWLAPGALAGTWCGTGENTTDLPDIVTGPQVHPLVVVPADGADDFPTAAGQLATDIATIDAWWQSQDPTRVLRFDQAAFPACTAPDISFLRLPQPASALTNGNAAFQAIDADLISAGYTNAYKNYLVYYDGPMVETNECGIGGGEFDQGGGLSVVWLQGCPGVPFDSVAAHELLHALGALPDGAPHACPNNPGHPCDSTHDVLYPYASGAPLVQLVLDYGHDDYYGHSGTWNDIQDSIFMHRLDLPQETLSIAFSGAGQVTSAEPGVVCTTTCSTQWDQNAAVDLEATPTASTRFLGWTGACTGNGPCNLTMASAESVVATFGPSVIALKATVSGKGKIVCTPACSTHFTAGNVVTMRAVPAKGWQFKTWTGACKGKKLVCQLQPDYPAAAKATFTRRATR